MREIVLTADGSHTVRIAGQGMTYHSVHGAIAESRHVFLDAGFTYVQSRQQELEPLRLFEMGFGTGLNAFLTAIRATETQTQVQYIAVETAPLSVGETVLLNYASRLGYSELFAQLHQSQWNKEVKLSNYFTIEKQQADLLNFSPRHCFDLIYYDAFAPSAQPELWTVDVFKKLHGMMQPGGALVTYCSKAVVQRALQAAGFTVTKLPGPKGKREMVRASAERPAG